MKKPTPKPAPLDSKARRMFGVRMDRTMIAAIKTFSADSGMTPGEVVRRAVAAFITPKGK